MFKTLWTSTALAFSLVLSSCSSLALEDAQNIEYTSTGTITKTKGIVFSPYSDEVDTLSELPIVAEDETRMEASFSVRPTFYSEHVAPEPEPIEEVVVEQPESGSYQEPEPTVGNESSSPQQESASQQQNQNGNAESSESRSGAQQNQPAPQPESAPEPAPAPDPEPSGRAQAERVAANVCGASVEWKNLGPGFLGMYNWGSSSIQITTREGVASQTLQYIAAHECAHVLQHRVFNGSLDEAKSRMNEIYNSSGVMGVEHNADCIAYSLGYYPAPGTGGGYGCPDGGMSAAQSVLNGQRP